MENMSQQQLKKMLNMSLKLSDAETKDFKETEMDDERKEFLKGAIDTALANDDSKRLVMYTNCFLTYEPASNFNDEQMDELETLFEALNYLLEGFDVALDFDSLGGLHHCLKMLRENPNDAIRRYAADLIANSIHNFPKCQKTILDNKGMETIITRVKTTTDHYLMTKCLYALSTLLSGNPTAEKLFCSMEDASFFINLFGNDDMKVKVKTSFLLLKLTLSEDTDTSKFHTEELTLKMIKSLSDEPNPSQIHILKTLVIFLSNKVKGLLPEDKIKCFRSSLNSKKRDFEKLDFSQYMEEIEACDKLLTIL